jgi:hypothetical protein
MFQDTSPQHWHWLAVAARDAPTPLMAQTGMAMYRLVVHAKRAVIAAHSQHPMAITVPLDMKWPAWRGSRQKLLIGGKAGVQHAGAASKVAREMWRRNGGCRNATPAMPPRGLLSACIMARPSVMVPSCVGVALKEAPTQLYTAGKICSSHLHRSNKVWHSRAAAAAASGQGRAGGGDPTQ